MTLCDFVKFYYLAETQKLQSLESLCTQEVKCPSWMMDIDGANMGRNLSKATRIQGDFAFPPHSIALSFPISRNCEIHKRDITDEI